MRNFLKKYIPQLMITILIATGIFSGLFGHASADLTPNFWANTAPNVLMTNASGGLATADIHVRHCYIGTGTGTSCGGGGGGTIGGSITADEVAFGTASNTIGGDSNHIINHTTGFTNLSATVGTSELGSLEVGNNILGLGIKGTGPVYTDSSDGIYGVGAVGDYSAIGGTPDMGIFGLTNLSGISSNLQTTWDGTNAGANLGVQSGSGQAKIQLTTDGTISDIKFNFGGGVNYTFPKTNPSLGEVIGYTGSNTLGFVTPPSPGTGTVQDTPNGVANQVSYFTGTHIITSDPSFTWNPSSKHFTAGDSTHGQIDASSSGVAANLNNLANFAVKYNGVSILTASATGFNPSIVEGDLTGSGNSTERILNDTAGTLTDQAGVSDVIQDISGNQIANFNTSTFDAKIGNIGHGNQTTEEIKDSTSSIHDTTGVAGTSGNYSLTDKNNNTFFEVDQPTETVLLGDGSGAWGNDLGLKIVGGGSPMIQFGNIISAGGTNFQLSGTNANTLDFGSGAYNSLVINNDPAVRTFEEGDTANQFNGTTRTIDDIGQTITDSTNGAYAITNTVGHYAAVISPSIYSGTDGDVTHSANGTTFGWNDLTQSYLFSKPNITIGTMSLVFPSSSGPGALINNGTGTLSWVPSQGSAVSGDLLAQTTAVSSVVTVTSPNDGVKHTYSLGAYLNVTAVTLDVIQEQVTYTDENGTSQTEAFFPPGLTSANIGSIGNSPMGTMNIRVNPNTAITVRTVLTTGTGSISYDVGGTIQLLK